MYIKDKYSNYNATDSTQILLSYLDNVLKYTPISYSVQNFIYERKDAAQEKQMIRHENFIIGDE